MDAILNFTDSPAKPVIFTPFTLFHMLMGVFAYMFLEWIFPKFSVPYNFTVWLLLHTIYETKDIYKKGTTNSLKNSLGDTLAAVIGFYLGFIIFGRRKFTVYDIINFGILVLIFNILLKEPST